MNKTIYMTYKNMIPRNVFERWIALNKDYTIDFSLDSDCIEFLEAEFNPYIASLFKTIPVGMFKADLWRLCKLYKYGGVYADVDLVPYVELDSLDPSITFYSCLSLCPDSIFQAFIVTTPRNPIILHCLLSFLLNNPYDRPNGPTYDMYNCLCQNLDDQKILSDTRYEIKTVKIPISIGSSSTNTKSIDLHYFPSDIQYSIELNQSGYSDTFTFAINDSILSVTRVDQSGGWDYNYSCTINIPANDSVYLFKELYGRGGGLGSCYVTNKGRKILDSRDVAYLNGGGW